MTLARAATFARWAVAGTLLLFAPLKWTEWEVAAVTPLVLDSPLTAWVPRLIGMTATTRLIGAMEAGFAILMLLRGRSARASLAGSLGATATFAVTFSMAFSTEAAWEGGSPTPLGWFLLKDVFFLVGAVVSAWETWRAFGASRVQPVE